jgi:hypothetical protein
MKKWSFHAMDKPLSVLAPAAEMPETLGFQ